MNVASHHRRARMVPSPGRARHAARMVAAIVLPVAWAAPSAPAQTAGAGAGAGPKVDHDVVLTNIEFRPNRIQVAKGDTIRFTNRDKFDHDVYMVRTANRNDVLHAATTLHSGQSVIVTVDQEGLFTLYCTIHGGMTGKVTTTGTFELTEEEKERAASHKVLPPIVKVGEELYWGRAQCHRCHMVGDRGTGLRGPNHQDLGFRAGARASTFGLESGTAYIVQSIMDPSAHLVESYSDDMPKVYQEPINLTEDDIKALVAYLQAQGGEVDTWSINISKVQLASRLPPDPFARGEPRRGERVFLDMGCNGCHTVGDRQAVSIAPDLTYIGAFRNWTWLARSITDPNAEIGANWKDVTVYLKPGVSLPPRDGDGTDEFLDEDAFEDEEDVALDDAASAASRELADARARMRELKATIDQLEAAQRRLADGGQAPADADAAPSASVALQDTLGEAAGAGEGDSGVPRAATDSGGVPDGVQVGLSVPGVLRKETPDEVTLLVGPDRLQTFPRDQVAAVVASKGSRMAGNYGELLTFDQLSDLIQYLESLKGMPPSP